MNIAIRLNWSMRERKVRDQERKRRERERGRKQRDRERSQGPREHTGQRAALSRDQGVGKEKQSSQAGEVWSLG